MVMNEKELLKLRTAARNDNPIALSLWASQFETQISKELKERYDKKYEEDLGEAIDTFCLSIAYVLMFSESTMMDKKDIPEFMDDLFATVGLFTNGEYNPEDYSSQLKENGVLIDDYSFSKKYRIVSEDKDGNNSKV